MRKILDSLKSYHFYVQLFALVTIVAAFVPELNPLVTYENGEQHMLISIFTDLGSVEKYFESILSSFSVLGNVLYLVMLLFYVGFVCYVCGLILFWAKAMGAKRSIFTGSLVFVMTYLALFVVYYSINLELFQNGSELISNAADVWLKIPLGVYVQLLLALTVSVLSILGSGIDFKAVWYGMRFNWIHRFDGGVHPTYHKNTRSKAIETLPPQKEMIYPLMQHIGALCEGG